MASGSDSMVYLYTSLTAGSSHIITATSRLETILKANKIPFRALDLSTDDKARTLWGRRAKGRKLPGLVKFGNVIADMDQVEEWNEFGELQEQIEAVDFAGVNPDAVKSNHPTATLPLDVKTPDPKSDPPSSRASSQGRHISISEPTQEEINAPPKLKSPNPLADSPMNMAMRQLGAEAAAKASQRKTSGSPLKAAPVPTSPSATAQTPTPATVKAQEVQEATEPADAESTAATSPALLAAEGKTATSTDKIQANTSTVDSESMPPPSSFPPTETLGSSDKSTEEQVLDLRRQSTQTNIPSRLSESTPIHESHQVLPEEAMVAPDPEPTEPKTKTITAPATGLNPANSKSETTPSTPVDPETTEPAAEPATEAQPSPTPPSTSTPAPAATASPSTPTTNPAPPASPSTTSPRRSTDLSSRPSAEVVAGARPRSHRGSSVEEADKAEIKRIEEQMRIKEEEEPEEDKEAIEGQQIRRRSSLNLSKGASTAAGAGVGVGAVAETKRQSGLVVVDDDVDADADTVLLVGKGKGKGTEKGTEGGVEKGSSLKQEVKPQDTKAKDAEAAGVSVGD